MIPRRAARRRGGYGAGLWCLVSCWKRRRRWRRSRWCRRRSLAAVTVCLATLWWLSRHWNRVRGVVNVGQSLSLRVDDLGRAELHLSSPGGATCLRGALGGVGDEERVSAAAVVRWCSVLDHEAICAELMVPGTGSDKPLLRLEVAYTEHEDCYSVKWRFVTSSMVSAKVLSVTDCYTLGDALWYGGAQVHKLNQPFDVFFLQKNLKEKCCFKLYFHYF